MDIQIGDIVTYKFLGNNEIRKQVITYEGFIKDLMDSSYYKILKIERPKYEVVEAKKELLTEEEKDFLKQYIKIIENLNNGKVNRIRRSEENIYLLLKTGINYHIEIGIKFGNMKVDKDYTLKELGLEEDK